MTIHHKYMQRLLTKTSEFSKSLMDYKTEAATRGVLLRKVVLRNFTKFTGKHLCQSLLFNKVAGLRPATLLKKWLWHKCYPVSFMKFLRTTFSQNIFW